MDRVRMTRQWCGRRAAGLDHTPEYCRQVGKPAARPPEVQQVRNGKAAPSELKREGSPLLGAVAKQVPHCCQET